MIAVIVLQKTQINKCALYVLCTSPHYPAASSLEKGVFYNQDHEERLDQFLTEDLPLVPVIEVKESPFYKSPGSGPRLVRRNDFFYAKTHKSVPRIGRRNDFFLKASKSIPRIGRRDDFTSQNDKESMMAWPWFRDHDFIPRVSKKDQILLTPSQLEKSLKEAPEIRQ